MTIDDVVDSVEYNGEELEISGQLTAWKTEKTFAFTSCDAWSPGTLVINGTDNQDEDHCVKGGLILTCTANDVLSPWHYFKTDMKNWENNEDPTDGICKEESLFKLYSKDVKFITDMIDSGAKKIWARSKHVSLKGMPPSGKLFKKLKLKIFNKAIYQ